MRNALITGAAKRVGRAMALHLAQQGWNIAIHYHHSANDAESLKLAIEALGQKAVLVQADLQDENALASVVESAANALGGLTLLINNAGRFHKDNLQNMQRADYDRHMNLHVWASLKLIQDFAALAATEQGGCNIINITDGMTGWSLSSGYLTYSLSKATLHHLTEALARELAPGIRINAIAPGATLPGEEDGEAEFARIAAHTPLQRVSSPEEVCQAVDYILSARSMTGQSIRLNAGAHIPPVWVEKDESGS